MTDVERLLYSWRIGQSVRAEYALHYGHKPAFVVPEGTVGIIEETRALGCTGLLRVRWPIPYNGEPSHTTETLASNVEPCPS